MYPWYIGGVIAVLILAAPLLLNLLVLREDRLSHLAIAYAMLLVLGGVGGVSYYVAPKYGHSPYSFKFDMYYDNVGMQLFMGYLVVGIGYFLAYDTHRGGNISWYTSREFLYYTAYAYLEHMLLLPLLWRVNFGV